MKSAICILVFILITVEGFTQNDTIFAEYETKTFQFKGRNAKVVFPKNRNDKNLWIWRARFWGHEPQTDIALLEEGFNLVYVDVAGLFGNKKAVRVWNKFYRRMTKKYKLNSKVVLEGFSRGGLIVYNWAAKNTNKVACIYADAPVCDIKSWPGGLYSGTGSPKEWAACLKAYKLNASSVLKFNGLPINKSIKVAKANIPVIHVYGDADELVPPSENTELLAKKMKLAGGTIKLIGKKGVGHHPHSLKDPKPIVDFILKATEDL